MTLQEFLNGVRVLWNIDMREYLTCINDEDREYFGDNKLWGDFAKDAHRTFANLPQQDQERVFAIIEKRNAKMQERNASIAEPLRAIVNSVSQ